VKGTSWPDEFYHEYWVNPERELYGRITWWRAEIYVGSPALIEPIDDREFDLSGLLSERATPEQAIEFTMPDGWVSSGRDKGGIIPNTTVMKLYFQTDLGWSGWLDYSPWLQRIPDGAEITFEVNSYRTHSWQIIEPELKGEIISVLYWYEGLDGWKQLIDTPPAPPLGTAFYLAISWANESPVTIPGHIDLAVARPDGTEVTPAATLNQDGEAELGSGWIVPFEAVTLEQAGTYRARTTLSTEGKVLDETSIDVAVVSLVSEFSEFAVMDYRKVS
jgi:hypothetical protein